MASEFIEKMETPINGNNILTTQEPNEVQDKPEVDKTQENIELLSDKENPSGNNENLQTITSNTCYCGKERNLNIAELLCANCNKWFHESCVSYQLGKFVPFFTNYIFQCKNCSRTGLESYKKNQAQISQMCITAIANLQQTSVKEGTNRTMFNKDKEIIPYIEYHWEALTTTSRRVTQSWHSTVLRSLQKEVNLLFTTEETSEGQHFGLLSPDLTQIKPNYEAMIKGGTLRITESGIQHVPVAGGVKNRNTKRKFPGDLNVMGKKGRNADLNAVKLPAHGYPLDHPFNKDGYRYLLAEPDPHAPYRQEFDESADWAGKPIPGWLYRTLVPATVLLALNDRAPQLKISEDRLAATGEKGYCSVRATHCVAKGCWYWEATIEEMPEGSATRIGWGQEFANLQAPLGYDKFGYSWRSRKGTVFHEQRGKHFSNAYGEGDTLGFMIMLPESNTRIPPTYKDKPLVKFRSHLYYEEKDNVNDYLKKLKPLPGSKILFFKNGELQGAPFNNIYGGVYYPTVSLHKNVTVSVNYGPNFKFPPTFEEYKYNGMHEKAMEAMCEQTMADMLYLTESEGRLRLDTVVM